MPQLNAAILLLETAAKDLEKAGGEHLNGIREHIYAAVEILKNQHSINSNNDSPISISEIIDIIHLIEFMIDLFSQ